MKPNAQKAAGRSGIELIEDAVRLLRRAPAAVHFYHLLGSVPCLISALFFVSDLSQSATAESHLMEASLSLGAMFIWMKCWQAVSAARLRATLLGKEPEPWNAGRIFRMIAVQAALQPVGLILRFWGAVLVLPYVWIANFFQNVVVLGDGTQRGVVELSSQAWTEAKRWTKQGHVIATLLLVLGFFIYLNVALLMGLFPSLLKMFFGLDSIFTQHPMGLLNVTFFLAAYALTYLCLDPIRKAVLILRCFHGRSIETGEDLAVELKSLKGAATRAGHFAAVLLTLACFVAPLSARAELPQNPPVESTELNQRIDQVLERREFSWRAPRGEAPKEEVKNKSWWGQWKEDVGKTLKDWANSIGRTIGKIFREIRDFIFGKKSEETKSESGGSFSGSIEVIAWVLLSLAGVILIILIAKNWRRPPLAAMVASALPVQPDLTQEHVTADQLPEDGWIQMARDLMQRGEYRLALRASYLASLAHLSQRDFIRLAKFKSNRDYQLELRRRARALEDVQDAFGRNLLAFESVWYGEHTVTSETLTEFTQNLDRIRAC